MKYKSITYEKIPSSVYNNNKFEYNRIYFVDDDSKTGAIYFNGVKYGSYCDSSAYYIKPVSGIPATDLSTDVQLLLDKINDIFNEVFSPDTSSYLSKKLADYYISSNPNLEQPANSGTTRKWSYQAGLTLVAMLRAYDVYGEPNLLNYALTYYHYHIGTNGIINSPTSPYSKTAYNLDHIQPGYNLFKLKELDTNSTYKNYYENVINILKDQLNDQPRVEAGTAHPYYHKAQYAHQVWLDGLYMSNVFRAEYARQKLSGSAQVNEYDDIVGQFIDVANFTYDASLNLYRHAWSEDATVGWVDPNGNGKSYFVWGRGIGWYMLGLIEVLDILPNDYQKRNELLKILNDICEVLPNYADAESGVWRNLPTEGATDSRNILEATVSSMCSYVYLHGVKQGYLPESMLTYAKELYETLVSRFITVSGSTVILKNCVTGGNPGASSTTREQVLENYYSKPIADNDLHGIGPFILASLEYESMFGNYISRKEDVINKVTEISSTSTHTQYPSAKCVYDTLQSMEASSITHSDINNWNSKTSDASLPNSEINNIWNNIMN